MDPTNADSIAFVVLSYTESQFYEAFKEQAEILAESGVDGFIIETMFDLQEALCALRACREVADLPVIVSIAFNTVRNGGYTIMGNSARDCAKALTQKALVLLERIVAALIHTRWLTLCPRCERSARCLSSLNPMRVNRK